MLNNNKNIVIKRQELKGVFNDVLTRIDDIQSTAMDGFDDDYLNAYQSLADIVKMCDDFYIFVDYAKQCYNLDKKPHLHKSK